MTKRSGAFLTIGELAAELNVPQHILRYWETRFPALRPLQRAGNRRYYRAEDVELARQINQLLNVEGYTVRGAQQALEGNARQAPTRVLPPQPDRPDAPRGRDAGIPDAFLERLIAIRDRLESALV